MCKKCKNIIAFLILVCYITSMGKSIRLFEIMQEKSHINLDKVFKWLDNVDCKYLCVFHDKDKQDFLHYHIMVKLNGARDIDDIAKQCDIAKQYINFGKSFNNMLAYSFHLTPDSQKDGKYVYDKSAVIKSKDIDVDEIFTNDKVIKAEQQRDKELQDMFFKYGELETTKDRIVNCMTAKDYHKYNRLFKDMKEFRQLKIKERNMQVIYITGESGTGKTTFAKYMARSKNYDVFVSGSGKDVLDGYDKQECIILDDLRADSFTKAELFKLTDNHTNSSVKSRYNNKDISNCKMLIITSVYSPHKLYNWLGDTTESFFQFARRLELKFIFIKDNFIYTIRYDANTLHNIGITNQDWLKDCIKTVEPVKMSDIYTALGIINEIDKNAEYKSLFDGILEQINADEKNKQLSLDDLNNDDI